MVMAQSSRSTYSSDSGGSPGSSPGHRTYMCKVCGNLFTSGQSLGGHMNVHRKQDPRSSPQSSTPPQFSGDYNSPGVESQQTVAYKGVRYRKEQNKWVAAIRPPRATKTWWLGIYSTPEEAAYAYDVAITYIGSKSSLNFNGHPIYDQIPTISTELQRQDFAVELRKVVKKYWKLAMESGTMTTVPTAPMSKPKFSTDSGGILGGSSGTASWTYKGVRLWGSKWVVEIRVPKGNKGNEGNKICLGWYSTPLEAAFAYDVAVMCLGGGESMLNFHHPMYKQIPRILPDLLPLWFISECKKVVREFLKLAKEPINSVPMTLVGKPKYNTDSGGSPGGVPGTSRECPDLCPECGKIFLASQAMLLHLMDHWRNQEFSPPSQSSRDSGGDSRSPGMDSRWWSMYKGVRYSKVDDWEVGVATHNSEELLPQVDDWEVHDKWAAWIWLPHGNEILLDLYSTIIEAAYAYDVAVTCLGGEPLLNFHRHPIYKQFPRISSALPSQVVAAWLKKVVKKFGKVAMDGGYSSKSIYTLTCQTWHAQV